MKRILITTGVVGALLSAGALGGGVTVAAKVGVYTAFAQRVSNVTRAGLGDEGPTTGGGGTGAWEMETVDADAGGYYGVCSIASDNQGRPHLVYLTNGGAVKYARWDGEQWDLQTVDDGVRSGDYDLAIKLDREGRPHIAYSFSVDDENPRSSYGYTYTCKYARLEGGKWDIDNVTTGVGYNGHLALALDNNDAAHLALVRCVDELERYRSELWYARHNGNAWEFELLADPRFLSGQVDILLTSGGEPRVLCGTLDFVKRAGRWEAREIPYAGPAALDANGRINLAFVSVKHPYYADPEDGEVHYARETGGGWAEETVDVKWGPGAGTSFALDRDGLPYISYFNNYDLRFAHFTGKEWVVHTVVASDSQLLFAYSTSIAVSDAGQPFIAYFENKTGALECARWGGGEWRNPPPSEADSSKDLTSAGEIVSWYLEGVPFLPEDPRAPVRTLESSRILAEPNDDAALLLEFDVPTDVAFVGGRSLRVTDEDMAGETWETYDAWVEVKVGDVVGWMRPLSYFSNDNPNPSFVRFGKKYSPLREGPSRDAPAAREDVKPGNRWRAGPTASAGQYFGVVGRINGWCCLERGFSEIWAPADAPGLEYFYLTYAWEPVDLAQFWFYLPGTAEIKRVFYSVETYMGAGGLPGKNPRLEIVVNGKKVEGVFRDEGYSGGYECGTEYFEFEFPRAVKREAVESMTFSVGDEGERVYFTVDPREAWRQPATERHWPSRGMA